MTFYPRLMHERLNADEAGRIVRLYVFVWSRRI
jgi:hypothetical protein